ncbi:unnamed protein product [Ilex paraguariensis]|uniref:F-box domain-containing protein n=1 Tax=Ilex paraguariensis TaxID=185542 RepID=A0ABC8TFZ7_9AQUA
MILELCILAFYATYGFWERSLEYLRRSKEIYGKVNYNEEDCLFQKRIEEYCLMNKYNGNDRISRLPDDILYSIISLLEVRDVVKASVLSRRWRYICASLSNTNIEFDLCKMFGRSNNCNDVGARLGLPGSYNKNITKEWLILNARRHIEPHLCPIVKHKFAQTVHQFIKLYLSPQICSFKFTNAVNRWISFATRMGVERFDLNFVCSSHIKYRNMYDDLYTEASNLKHLRVYSCMLKPDICCRFNTLLTLDLNYVPLTQGDLENLLVVCLKLETVMVKQCNLPVKFCIFGPPSLQTVVVNCCRGLKEIELSAINLSTFELTDFGTIKISFSMCQS